MTKDKYVEILLYNGYTKHDAIKYFENGSIIYDDLQENVDEYIRHWDEDCMMCFEDDEKAEIKEKILSGKNVFGLEHIYDKDGRLYYFEPRT